MKRLALLVCLLGLAVPAAIQARTWYILPDGTGDVPTIQAGMDSASTGDTVLVGCGTYLEYGISVRSGVCLRSETGAPDCATIDGQHLGRIFTCHSVDPPARIEGLTIARGYADQGGAVNCQTASVIFSDCVFRENQADAGGGVFCWEGGTVLLRNCIFYDNTAALGGAVMSWHWSRAVLTNCTVAFSQNGAAVFLAALGLGTFTNTIIAFTAGGEALWADDEDGATIRCCDFYGNEGGDWIGYISDDYGVNGNFSADPRFCDTANLDYHVRATSPCAWRRSCGRIGALGVGCGIEERQMGEDRFVGRGAEGDRKHGTTRAELGLTWLRKHDRQIELQYSLPQDGHVTLTVHDARGRSLRVLVDAQESAGAYSEAWDGCDETGTRVAPGVYFAVLKAGAQQETKKLLILK